MKKLFERWFSFLTIICILLSGMTTTIAEGEYVVEEQANDYIQQEDFLFADTQNTAEKEVQINSEITNDPIQGDSDGSVVVNVDDSIADNPYQPEHSGDDEVVIESQDNQPSVSETIDENVEDQSALNETKDESNSDEVYTEDAKDMDEHHNIPDDADKDGTLVDTEDNQNNLNEVTGNDYNNTDEEMSSPDNALSEPGNESSQEIQISVDTNSIDESILFTALSAIYGEDSPEDYTSETDEQYKQAIKESFDGNPDFVYYELQRYIPVNLDENGNKAAFAIVSVNEDESEHILVCVTDKGVQRISMDDIYQWPSDILIINNGNQKMIGIEKWVPHTEIRSNDLWVSDAGELHKVNKPNNIFMDSTDDKDEFIGIEEYDFTSEFQGKKYYFHYSENSMVEYGGIYITKEELLEFDNAEKILKDSRLKGEITNIIYRGNGIINVNFKSDPESMGDVLYKAANGEYSITLRYDSTSVSLVESHRPGDDEYKNITDDTYLYHKLACSDNAVYPDHFVHPKQQVSPEPTVNTPPTIHYDDDSADKSTNSSKATSTIKESPESIYRSLDELDDYLDKTKRLLSVQNLIDEGFDPTIKTLLMQNYYDHDKYRESIGYKIAKHNTDWLQDEIDNWKTGDRMEGNKKVIELPKGTFMFAPGGHITKNRDEGRQCYAIKCASNVIIRGQSMDETVLIPVAHYPEDEGKDNLEKWYDEGFLQANPRGMDMFYFNDYEESLSDKGNYTEADKMECAKYLEHVFFENFSIDGSSAQAAITGIDYSSAGKGFMINLMNDVHWKNVAVCNTDGTGFGVDSPINCSMESCKAIGCGKAADHIGHGGSGFGIGVGYSPEETMTISNCYAEGNGKNGFFFENQDEFNPENHWKYSGNNESDFDKENNTDKYRFVVENCTSIDNLFNFAALASGNVDFVSCKSIYNDADQSIVADLLNPNSGRKPRKSIIEDLKTKYASKYPGQVDAIDQFSSNNTGIYTEHGSHDSFQEINNTGIYFGSGSRESFHCSFTGEEEIGSIIEWYYGYDAIVTKCDELSQTARVR